MNTVETNATAPQQAPAKTENVGEIRLNTKNPQKEAVLAEAAKNAKKGGAVKKTPAKKTAAPKMAAKKPAPKAVSGKKPTPAKNAAPAKGKPAPKKPSAPKPAAKKNKSVAKKGQVGGAREGSGRKSIIKDKKRQTIDFTGDHKKRLGKKSLQKHFGANGVSPLIRVILDRILPVLEKEAAGAKAK